MKILFVFFILLLAVSSCSRGFYTSHVQSVPGATEQGRVYVEATGLGRFEEVAYNSAALNAFNTILFRGLPASPQPLPLIGNEEMAKREHAIALKCFDNFDCYNQFIISTEKVGFPQREHRGLAVTLKIKINLRSLRAYLEKNTLSSNLNINNYGKA